MSRKPKRNVQDAQAKVKERTEQALQSFLGMMESGSFPATVAQSAVLSRCSNAPSSKWSTGNQMMMIACGTLDSRGYRQWQEVGRQVKKGSKAVYICRPNTATRTVEDEKTGEEQKRTFVTGFAYTPVFRVEDTEGEPLPAYDPPELPPLVDVAEALGVSVAYAPPVENWLGYYRDSTAEIVLCDHNQRTFFHELAHAAHYRLSDNAANAQSCKVRKEIVADTAAAALCNIYGYEYGKTIAGYLDAVTESNGDSQKALREIMKYVGEVRDVLELILTTEAHIKDQGEAA